MVKHGTIRLKSVSLPKRSEPQMPVYLNQDDALSIWRDALSASVRADGPDLSSRQMAILLTVYSQSPPHTVRGLSDSLNISKPAIFPGLGPAGTPGLLPPSTRPLPSAAAVQVQRNG
jgi:Predicted DNA binding protein